MTTHDHDTLSELVGATTDVAADRVAQRSPDETIDVNCAGSTPA